MPDSMYDKLGELLSEAIESGNFFDQTKPQPEKKESGKDSIKKYTQNEDFSQNSEKEAQSASKINNSKTKTVYKSIQSNTQPHVRIVSPSEKVIKYAHPVLQKACTFVGVNEDMNYEQAKKQYHKKLLRFHPDKNADNETMNKITREKTAEIVEAWKIIEQYFNS